jgi:unsaturated chondroitin disaccharide hydrolase
MMNLEMLFWASQNSENKSLYQIADNHAQTTSKNQFRPDFSCYHVVVYDTLTGKKIKGVTHQGYSDSSMWARGQAWAIYGFTMCYRETRRTGYLDLAENAADVYLKRLPEDAVPYWDFDAPGIPNAPKDASAAGIAASALLELSVLNTDNAVAAKYFGAALRMLKSLSSDGYLSRSANPAFLLHSTGHKPNNSEIDASIIYADYYYLEALIRLKKIQEGKSIYENL